MAISLLGALAKIKSRLPRGKRDSTEARLRKLKARLRPHPLFSSLELLLDHSPSDAETARSFRVRLIDLCKMVLAVSDKAIITLGEELKITRLYLELEEVRLSIQLEYRIEIPAHAQMLRIPSLALQALVENVVKFGARTSQQGVSVSIEIRELEDEYELCVTERGAWSQSLLHERKISLRNARERIASACGPCHGFAIEESEGSDTRIRFYVPKQISLSSPSVTSPYYF